MKCSRARIPCLHQSTLPFSVLVTRFEMLFTPHGFYSGLECSLVLMTLTPVWKNSDRECLECLFLNGCYYRSERTRAEGLECLYSSWPNSIGLRELRQRPWSWSGSRRSCKPWMIWCQLTLGSSGTGSIRPVSTTRMLGEWAHGAMISLELLAGWSGALL